MTDPIITTIEDVFRDAEFFYIALSAENELQCDLYHNHTLNYDLGYTVKYRKRKFGERRSKKEFRTFEAMMAWVIRYLSGLPDPDAEPYLEIW
jgi:hypothetical protein